MNKCLFLFLFPVFLLTAEEKKPVVLKEVTYEAFDKQSKRMFTDYTLETEEIGTIHCTLSLPMNPPSRGLPLIVLVAGRETGSKSLQYIPNHGQFAILAYEYPATLKNLGRFSKIFQMFKIRQDILHIPAQILATTSWAKTQDWVDDQYSPSIMGFSFGSIFVPPAYNFAQQRGETLGPGVLGYGGAGLYCLFYHNLPSHYWPKWVFSRFFAWAFRSLEPKKHLPYIKGVHFLVMNGVFDTQIPWKCAKRFQDLVPEPKTVLNLETAHMHPNNPELLAHLAELSRKWLLLQLGL